MKGSLREIGPQSIAIAAIDEKEPRTFAEQFAEAFETAGWNVTGHGVKPDTNHGTCLVAHCPSCLPRWTEQLGYLLNVEMDLPSIGLFSTDIPERTLGIFINKTPPATIPMQDIGFPRDDSKQVLGSYVDENGQLPIRYTGDDGPQADSDSR